MDQFFQKIVFLKHKKIWKNLKSKNILKRKKKTKKKLLIIIKLNKKLKHHIRKNNLKFFKKLKKLVINQCTYVTIISKKKLRDLSFLTTELKGF